jgi:hypothetical protein
MRSGVIALVSPGKLHWRPPRRARTDTGIHSYPCACTGICVVLGMKLRSSAVRQVSYTGSLRFPSTLRRTAFDYWSCANGTAAAAHRSPDELRTTCTVTLGPTQAKTHAGACAWIAVDTKTVPVVAEPALKKFFGRTGRSRQMLTVLGGLAEFERSLIMARTQAGIQRAKEYVTVPAPRESDADSARQPTRVRALADHGQDAGGHSARQGICYSSRPTGS